MDSHHYFRYLSLHSLFCEVHKVSQLCFTPLQTQKALLPSKTHSFGKLLSPTTLLAKKDLTSKLLRTF